MDGVDHATVGISRDEAHAREAALQETATNIAQALPSSLPAARSRPSTRRSPLAATPIATRHAIETIRPPSRTLTYVASRSTYG